MIDDITNYENQTALKAESEMCFMHAFEADDIDNKNWLNWKDDD